MTWTIGGVGLVLCGVVGMLQYSLPYAGSFLTITREVVFAAAILLFAAGLSREASVVARRPLGVAALAVVALWPIILRIAEPLLPNMDAASSDAGMDAYRSAAGVWTTVFYMDLVVSLAAAVVVVVQVARARILPERWRWAPLWALLVSVAAAVIPPLLLVSLGPVADQNILGAASALGSLGFLAQTLGLGIIALVLAARVREGEVEVFRSA